MIEKTQRQFLRFFIDESGTPDRYDPRRNNPSEKYFTLCAVAIEETQYKEFKKGMTGIHAKFAKYIDGKEIKCRDIRRSNPKVVDKSKLPEYEFWKYPEGKEMYAEFCKDINVLINITMFDTLSVTVNKEFAQKNYSSYNVLDTALNDLWERICIYKFIYKAKKTRILFDPRSNVSDQAFRESLKAFLSKGTNYIDKGYIEGAKLHPIAYSPDSKESYGLQLADLCAYPIRAYHERGESPHFETVIKPKLFQKIQDPETNKFINMSLKLTLSK